MTKGGAREGAGRPSLFTTELGARIVQRVEETGKSPRSCAAQEGVALPTFDGWMVRGRAGDPALAEFHESVTRAYEAGKANLHDRVLCGDAPGLGFGPAKAALEILSRTDRRYSQKVQVGVEAELERILDAVARVCSPEDFQRVLAELAALDSEEAAGGDADRPAATTH